MERVAKIVFIFLIIQCSLNSQALLSLQDSIVIRSSMIPDYFLNDINYSEEKNDFIVRYFKYLDSLDNQIEIISAGMAKDYKLIRSEVIAAKCDMYQVQDGYLLPKYWGNKLIYFDDKSQSGYPVLKNPNYKSFVANDNYNLYGKSDGYICDSLLLIHCYNANRMVNYKWKESKIIKKLNEYYQDPILFWVNIRDGKTTRPFAHYPNYLIDQLDVFRPNMEFYFCVDKEKKLIYLSFSGYSMIYSYDFTGNLIDSFSVVGISIDTSKLHMIKGSKSVLSFPAYYKIGLDSFGEMRYSGGFLYRVYRKALAAWRYEFATPNPELNACRPKEIENWNKLERSKPKVLQQVDLASKTHKEYQFPNHMDLFLGYNNEKSEYYFRKFDDSNFFKNQDAVIYIYKDMGKQMDYFNFGN